MRRATVVLLICLMSALRLPAATDWRTAPASDRQQLFNLKDQDWPISVEAQFLAGGRTTMNVCTAGPEIFMHAIGVSSRQFGR